MIRFKSQSGFLSKYGFKLGTGAQGQYGFVNTYIHSNDTECLWVTIDFHHKKVYFYNELECGGLLNKWDVNIPEDIIDDEDGFITWLEQYIPEN